MVSENVFPPVVVILQVNSAPSRPEVVGFRGRIRLCPPSSLSSTAFPTATTTHSILTTSRWVEQVMFLDSPTRTGVSCPLTSRAEEERDTMTLLFSQITFHTLHIHFKRRRAAKTVGHSTRVLSYHIFNGGIDGEGVIVG